MKKIIEAMFVEGQKMGLFDIGMVFNKNTIKHQLRNMADQNERMENIIFEIGISLIAKKIIKYREDERYDETSIWS